MGSDGKSPTTSSSSFAPSYSVLVTALMVTSVLGGILAGRAPINTWRYFSWHPFLMTIGMVGLAGLGAVTKKQGGYTNTKNHALLGWASILASLAGLYIIYDNKESNERPHLTSNHSWAGVGVMVNCVGLGMAGSIFLHPDFGVDKTNKLIRKAHKLASRATLILAWFTAIAGLVQMNTDSMTVALYSVPLLALIPFTLL